MEFIAGRSFTKQRKQVLQPNDKLYEGMELHTKSIRFSPEHRGHQASTQDNDGQGKDVMGKMSWWGNIESCLHLQAIIFLQQMALLNDMWKAQFLGFMKLKRTIQLRPPQICLETLSIYIHLKMEMEEFVA